MEQYFSRELVMTELPINHLVREHKFQKNINFNYSHTLLHVPQLIKHANIRIQTIKSITFRSFSRKQGQSSLVLFILPRIHQILDCQSIVCALKMASNADTHKQRLPTENRVYRSHHSIKTCSQAGKTSNITNLQHSNVVSLSLSKAQMQQIPQIICKPYNSYSGTFVQANNFFFFK